MITIEDAVERQRHYRAKESYRLPLNETTIVAAVGATAVGKNFLMEKSGLPVVGTVTTRQPQERDTTGHYRYVSLPSLLEKIENRELVQYGAYPPNIYASELEDYVIETPNISDIYHNAVAGLQDKGFAKVVTFSTLTPKEQWMSQLAERFEGMRVGEIIARLDEARQSLGWTRAQLGTRATNHLVIINTVDTVSENTERIVNFAHGKRVDSPHDETVFHFIEGMEKAIEIQYSRLES